MVRVSQRETRNILEIGIQEENHDNTGNCIHEDNFALLLQSIDANGANNPDLIHKLENISNYKADAPSIIEIMDLFDSLKDYKRTVKRNCCKDLLTNLPLIGSVFYLLGSICFSSAAFIITDASVIKVLGLIGTGLYLCGGILFMISACKPWHKKLKLIKNLEKELHELELTTQRRITAELRIGIRNKSSQRESLENKRDTNDSADCDTQIDAGITSSTALLKKGKQKNKTRGHSTLFYS
eukprot:505112_1